MPSTPTFDDPRYVKAMSHPLRIRILAMLGERVASPNQLAAWLGEPLGTVSYHVRTLRQLGLIELRHETRVRGAVEHHYQARERPSVSDAAWGAAPPIAKQAAIGSSLQVIDEYAHISAAVGGFDRPDSHLSRSIAPLDAEGWKQLSEACSRLIADFERIQAEAADRIAADPHDETVKDAALVTMLFEAARLSGAGEPAVKARRSRGRRAAVRV